VLQRYFSAIANSLPKKSKNEKKNCQRHPQKPAQEMSFRQENHFLNSSIHHSTSPSLFSSLLHPKLKRSNLADSNIRSLVDTVLGRTLATSGRLLVVIVGTLVFLADVLDRLCAGLCDGGGVAVVAVDADEVLSVGSLDVVDDDFSGTTVL
jgi:hypothetical protein